MAVLSLYCFGSPSALQPKGDKHVTAALHGGSIMVQTPPVKAPYTGHPYQTSQALAQRLISNNLTGVTVQYLAGRIDLVGYYRLKGYWYPYLTPCEGNSGKRQLPFQAGTTWKAIWDHYTFDQQLRDVVFDGIVILEVFLKNHIASELAAANGPFGYTQPKGLPNLDPNQYKKAITCFKNGFQRSTLPHISHFRNTYSDQLPPIWMLTGCLSYGEFQKALYTGSDTAIKEDLAAQLGIIAHNTRKGNKKILGDWLETIRVVRNKTAHHDRLWNDKNKYIKPMIPRAVRNDPNWWSNDWKPFATSQGIATFLTMENYLLNQLGVMHWHKDFMQLMRNNPQINTDEMGFPSGWQQLKLWR